MAPITAMSSDAMAGLRPRLHARPRSRLARSDDPTTLEIGGILRSRCAGFAARYGRAGAISVTCAAATAHLPRATAIQFNLIAAELLGCALAAFDGDHGGRIGVLFDTTATSLELTVEHSRPPPRAATCQGVVHSWLARILVARLGGRMTHVTVLGGARTTVRLPRP